MHMEPRCITCAQPIKERTTDPGYWVDPDGWFMSEVPTLHAHRPSERAEVVVLRDEVLASG